MRQIAIVIILFSISIFSFNFDKDTLRINLNFNDVSISDGFEYTDDMLEEGLSIKNQEKKEWFIKIVVSKGDTVYEEILEHSPFDNDYKVKGYSIKFPLKIIEKRVPWDSDYSLPSTGYITYMFQQYHYSNIRDGGYEIIYERSGLYLTSDTASSTQYGQIKKVDNSLVELDLSNVDKQSALEGSPEIDGRGDLYEEISAIDFFLSSSVLRTNLRIGKGLAHITGTSTIENLNELIKVEKKISVDVQRTSIARKTLMQNAFKATRYNILGKVSNSTNKYLNF